MSRTPAAQLFRCPLRALQVFVLMAACSVSGGAQSTTAAGGPPESAGAANAAADREAGNSAAVAAAPAPPAAMPGPAAEPQGVVAEPAGPHAAPTPADFIRADAGIALFAVTMIMWLSPKLATFIDVLTRAKERWSFGGTGRFLLSAAGETVFSLLLAPIMWFGHTLFLARMPLRRTVGWAAQMRDDHAVPLGLACRALWPHTLVGAGVLLILALTHPAAIPYALPLAAGLALAIPLAVITAIPAVYLMA